MPGKNPKPPAAQHRQQLFRSLLEGVRRIEPEIAADIESADSFTLIAWNHTFYGKDTAIKSLMPWIDLLLQQHTYPDADLRQARRIKYRLARFLYQLGDRLHWIIPFLPDKRIKASIQDTSRYFSNKDDIACRVREFQKAALREASANQDKVLLIGHSMGSIIAYDALWELCHLENYQHCVDTLLTIGSPLGMNYVQNFLRGHKEKKSRSYPGNIRHWVNIASRGDLVALDPSLEDDFNDMITAQLISSITDHHQGVFNHYRDSKGLNVHKSYGYLVNPVVARTIANWWRSA